MFKSDMQECDELSSYGSIVSRIMQASILILEVLTTGDVSQASVSFKDDPKPRTPKRYYKGLSV